MYIGGGDMFPHTSKRPFSPVFLTQQHHRLNMHRLDAKNRSTNTRRSAGGTYRPHSKHGCATGKNGKPYMYGLRSFNLFLSSTTSLTKDSKHQDRQSHHMKLRYFFITPMIFSFVVRPLPTDTFKYGIGSRSKISLRI